MKTSLFLILMSLCQLPPTEVHVLNAAEVAAEHAEYHILVTRIEHIEQQLEAARADEDSVRTTELELALASAREVLDAFQSHDPSDVQFYETLNGYKIKADWIQGVERLPTI